MKYSCSLFRGNLGAESGAAAAAALDAAVDDMLNLYVQRAQVEDGHTILELGCGWGSLSVRVIIVHCTFCVLCCFRHQPGKFAAQLFLLEKFPRCKVVCVSNSASQRKFIEKRATAEGCLSRLTVITADINVFAPPSAFTGRFDRVLSVEMFEHVRNYEQLFRRIAQWLAPEGLMFVHIFSHMRFAYPYEVRDGSDWMTKNFFQGGQMPSHDLFLYFNDALRVVNQWRVCGTHYGRTSEAWLANFDTNIQRIRPILRTAYGDEAVRYERYWRTFFISCAEFFNFDAGREWGVSHYLFCRANFDAFTSTSPRKRSRKRN